MATATRVALVILAGMAVGAGAAWIEAAPQQIPAPAVAGTLGAATQDFCRLDQSGGFTDQQIRDAMTCRDLAAQESMARSTADVAWLGWLQVIVGVAGTLGVLWTLGLTIRSMSLTREALAHGKLAARHQLRPALTPLGASITYTDDGKCRVAIKFANNGEPTARNFRQGWAYAIAPLGSDCRIPFDTLRLKVARDAVPKDGDTGFAVQLPTNATAGLKSGKFTFQAAYCATYEDEFGGRYCFTFAREYWQEDLSAYRTMFDFQFTEPELAGREN